MAAARIRLASPISSPRKMNDRPREPRFRRVQTAATRGVAAGGSRPAPGRDGEAGLRLRPANRRTARTYLPPRGPGNVSGADSVPGWAQGGSAENTAASIRAKHGRIGPRGLPSGSCRKNERRMNSRGRVMSHARAGRDYSGQATKAATPISPRPAATSGSPTLFRQL